MSCIVIGYSANFETTSLRDACQIEVKGNVNFVRQISLTLPKYTGLFMVLYLFFRSSYLSVLCSQSEGIAGQHSLLSHGMATYSTINLSSVNKQIWWA